MLGGGGLLGSMYEIGCLAALERHAPDRRLTFDLYVGTSGGSVVASLLAAGYSATQLMEMVDAFSPANLFRLNLSAFLRASVRLPLQMTRQLLTGLLLQGPSLFEALSGLQKTVPAGLLSLDPLAAFLASAIGARGLEGRFDALPRRLYVPAIDLDTGERIVFGDPEHVDISVSKAVAASCAIPRFFQPVRYHDRHLIDGGIADALNLDVAIDLRPRGSEFVVDRQASPGETTSWGCAGPVRDRVAAHSICGPTSVSTPPD